ncbi:tryptophanyl-tRNA synthetase [compost metagenome]
MECKRILADSIVSEFAPVRERAAELRSTPGEVRRILDEGAERARAIARASIEEVRRLMGLDWRR